MIYCQLYGAYIKLASPTLLGSLLWAIIEYGLWVLITPLLLITYSRLGSTHKLSFIGVWALSALCLTLYRSGIDVHHNASFISNFVKFAPTQLSAATFIVLGWAIVMRPNQVSAKNDEPPEDTMNTQELSSADVKTLTVQTGTLEIDLAINTIESISAAGNYMEVYDGNKAYIIRTTMKELEQILRPHRFFRIHRSHLVNQAAIKTVYKNQSVKLQSGQMLPATRRYLKLIDTNQ